MSAITATDPIEIPAERRQDAGYQRRLLEEIHEWVSKIRKCLFEGNGELALVTRMEIQEQAQIKIREEVDTLKDAVTKLCKTQQSTQIVMLIFSGFISVIVAPILVAAFLGVAVLIWAIITHHPIYYTP